MFNNYKSSGKHMICDFKNIKNNKLLNSLDDIKSILNNICIDNNFTILNTSEYLFDPIGCSIIFLLSESHISIHTFPEKNHMSFDIYTCRQYTNNDEYLKIFNYLLGKLNASPDSKCTILDRYF